MSEEKSVYQVYSDYAVTKTYSLTMAHIGKVSDLAQRLGLSQGEIVRRAIDLLYKNINEIEAETKEASNG